MNQESGSHTDPSHSTETEDPFTTVYVRRQALPTPESSIFSSILARPASDVAFACSCLQTPTTTSITVTQTATSQTIITPIVSNNITITPPVVTLQTTEVAIITEYITTTDATLTLGEFVTTTITPQADPTQSSSCYGLDEFDICGSGGCHCYTSAAGPLVCAQDSDCQYGSCSTDADCGPSMICAVGTGCGSTCLYNTCENPTRKLIRMARGERQRRSLLGREWQG